MLDTSARLLRLLSLLQSRRSWRGPELAERLGVTTRTVRRDVERLRQLGYPVDAAPSASGGYRLGAGATLPPLLLDDDEATAVAVALGSAVAGAGAGSAVRGIEDASLGALAKIDRLLPPAVRTRVRALQATTERLPARAADPVDADLLAELSQASAELERVALRYTDRNGRTTERRVEPYRLVATGRRWYLVARDVDRAGGRDRDGDRRGDGERDDGWRTLRVDRIGEARRTGHRFERVDPPDAAALVSASISVRPYRHRAVVRFDAPAAEVAARVPPTVAVVEPDPDEPRRGSILTTGAEDLDLMAAHLISVALPFEVREPPELRARLHELGARLLAAHADDGAGH